MSALDLQPRVKLPPKRNAPVETILCQAVVPKEVLELARKEWRSRGLTARQVVTWALLEYVTAVAPKKAKKLQKVVGAL